MNAIKRMTLLAAAATALMLAGCDQPVEPAAKAGPKLDAPVAKVVLTPEQAKIALADAAITAKIKIELAEEPSLAALQIKVSTKEGLVDLTGTAPDTSLRDRATCFPATVKGVLSVDNHMVVANG